MRYTAYLDVERQTIVIEDRAGHVVAIKPLPTTRYPNPGRAELLSIPENAKAWEAAYELVQAANK